MTRSTVAPRPGRAPSVDFDQVVLAAVALADEQGLDAVTFRALAARLGVSPMAVHRTTGGVDRLLHAVVSRSVADAVRSLVWPEDWRDLVREFAAALRSLLLRHPAVLEAHQHAPLAAPEGTQASEAVLGALADAGLAPVDAVHAYLAVHDYVTGHVALQLGRGRQVPLPDGLGPRQEAARALYEQPDYDRRFTTGVELLVRGIASLAKTP